MIGARRFSTMLTLMVLASVSSASAVDIFDNLANVSAATGASYSSNDLQWNAQKFQTDGQSYDLVDVTLSMLLSAGTGNATLQIYSDSSGSPNASIATLTSPGSYSGTLSNTTFTASGVTLAPNSAYWVVLKGPDSNTIFEWSFTDDNTGSGVGFTTNWAYSDNLGSSWNPSSTSPYQMRVSVQPVPEPSSVILAGLGLAAAVFASRRKARSAGRTA